MSTKHSTHPAPGVTGVDTAPDFTRPDPLSAPVDRTATTAHEETGSAAARTREPLDERSPQEDVAGGTDHPSTSTTAQPDPTHGEGKAKAQRDTLGRFAASLEHQADVAAARVAVAAGDVTPWREQLETEFAQVLASSRRLQASLSGGVLTRKGQLRAPYRRYLILADRLASIARLLGFDVAAVASAPRPTSFAQAIAEAPSHE